MSAAKIEHEFGAPAPMVGHRRPAGSALYDKGVTTMRIESLSSENRDRSAVFAATFFNVESSLDVLERPAARADAFTLECSSMIFVALASDYDGTVAQDGNVDSTTLAALDQAKVIGRRLILVTGRELPSLRACFEGLKRFDIVVAENGALLFNPATGEERLISAPPPEQFVAALRAKNVHPLSVGRGIVATWTPNETIVLTTIRELGLDWQVIFNKGAVMCLAPGVNKATGLAAALAASNLSPLNVVGIGDAENDLAFLSRCGCSVAVANALATVKAKVDIVTSADHGAGVSEFLHGWGVDVTRTFAGLRRHDLYLGDGAANKDAINLRADNGAILLAGSSGVGKSKIAGLLMERITDRGYQVCVVDPEGDYETLSFLEHVGDTQRTPAPEEVAGLLQSPTTNLSLILLGTDISERPAYFAGLLGELRKLRASAGRPHWIVLDEAHHLSPRDAQVQDTSFPAEMSSVLIITTHPRMLSSAALATVQTVIAVGDGANETIAEFCRSIGESEPPQGPNPGEGEVLVWQRRSTLEPQPVSIGKAREDHRRHTRKYAEGRLGEDKSFYFTGPAHLLNLRAHNLAAFLQLAQGIDDDTWLFHLRNGDYTRWFRNSIKDDDLADEVQGLESSQDPARSRSELAASVKRRYAAADIDG
jgi:HAD superfamily hydrolase (TIGR01484 family)